MIPALHCLQYYYCCNAALLVPRCSTTSWSAYQALLSIFAYHSLQMTIPPRPPPSHAHLTQPTLPLLAPPSSSFLRRSSSLSSPISPLLSFSLSPSFTRSSTPLLLTAPYGSTFTPCAGHRDIKSSTSR